MSDNLRFAVIGCGRMGHTRIRTIREHAQARVVAIMDRDRAVAEKASAEFGLPAPVSVEAILHNQGVDCVYVSVPTNDHRDLVIAACDAGKHVFTEKPLAGNVADAVDMVEAARRNGVTLKVGSNFRYFPNVLKAKELFDAGAIGRALFLRGWIGHQGWNLKQWYGNARIAGGGTFLDNGCHVFDMARWFLGEPKTCIGSVTTKLWAIGPLEDNGVGIFDMECGATATIQASWTEWAGYAYLEIYGSEGYIRIDSRGKTCTTTLGDREAKEQVFDYSALPPSSYTAEFADYLKALRTGKEPAPNGQDGLRAVAMAFAVYEASRTGRRVGLAVGRESRIGAAAQAAAAD